MNRSSITRQETSYFKVVVQGNMDSQKCVEETYKKILNLCNIETNTGTTLNDVRKDYKQNEDFIEKVNKEYQILLREIGLKTGETEENTTIVRTTNRELRDEIRKIYEDINNFNEYLHDLENCENNLAGLEQIASAKLAENDDKLKNCMKIHLKLVQYITDIDNTAQKIKNFKNISQERSLDIKLKQEKLNIIESKSKKEVKILGVKQLINNTKDTIQDNHAAFVTSQSEINSEIEIFRQKSNMYKENKARLEEQIKEKMMEEEELRKTIFQITETNADLLREKTEIILKGQYIQTSKASRTSNFDGIKESINNAIEKMQISFEKMKSLLEELKQQNKEICEEMEHENKKVKCLKEEIIASKVEDEHLQKQITKFHEISSELDANIKENSTKCQEAGDLIKQKEKYLLDMERSNEEEEKQINIFCQQQVEQINKSIVILEDEIFCNEGFEKAMEMEVAEIPKKLTNIKEQNEAKIKEIRETEKDIKLLRIQKENALMDIKKLENKRQEDKIKENKLKPKIGFTPHKRAVRKPIFENASDSSIDIPGTY